MLINLTLMMSEMALGVALSIIKSPTKKVSVQLLKLRTAKTMDFEAYMAKLKVGLLQCDISARIMNMFAN
jgi:hypothetical protein